MLNGLSLKSRTPSAMFSKSQKIAMFCEELSLLMFGCSKRMKGDVDSAQKCAGAVKSNRTTMAVLRPV
jgi:hypothetical protein